MICLAAALPLYCCIQHAHCTRSLLQGGFGNEGRQGVVVLLPAGRYVVTQTIEITQSNVVVRGEGVRAD